MPGCCWNFERVDLRFWNLEASRNRSGICSGLCSHLRFQFPDSSFHVFRPADGRSGNWKLYFVEVWRTRPADRVLTQSIRAQHTSKQRRKPGACRRGKRLKLRQLKLTKCGFRIETAFCPGSSTVAPPDFGCLRLLSKWQLTIRAGHRCECSRTRGRDPS